MKNKQINNSRVIHLTVFSYSLYCITAPLRLCQLHRRWESTKCSCRKHREKRESEKIYKYGKVIIRWSFFLPNSQNGIMGKSKLMYQQYLKLNLLLARPLFSISFFLQHPNTFNLSIPSSSHAVQAQRDLRWPFWRRKKDERRQSLIYAADPLNRIGKLSIFQNCVALKSSRKFRAYVTR
jgi:hypothetical protein